MRCFLCNEPLALSDMGAPVDGGDGSEGTICTQPDGGCDATFSEQLRPSLGGAVAFLRRADEVNQS